MISLRSEGGKQKKEAHSRGEGAEEDQLHPFVRRHTD